jgi:hypothetical protein
LTSTATSLRAIAEYIGSLHQTHPTARIDGPAEHGRLTPPHHDRLNRSSHPVQASGVLLLAQYKQSPRRRKLEDRSRPSRLALAPLPPERARVPIEGSGPGAPERTERRARHWETVRAKAKAGQRLINSGEKRGWSKPATSACAAVAAHAPGRATARATPTGTASAAIRVRIQRKWRRELVLAAVLDWLNRYCALRPPAPGRTMPIAEAESRSCGWASEGGRRPASLASYSRPRRRLADWRESPHDRTADVRSRSLGSERSAHAALSTRARGTTREA